MKGFLQRLISNFPLGAFVGVQGTLLLVFAFSRQDFDKLSNTPAYIFAASTTLLASSIAIAGVLLSLQWNENNRQFERQRKLESARAFLPSALSNFCGICRLGSKMLHEVYEATNRNEKLAEIESDLHLLNLHDEIVSVFRDVLEFVDDELVSLRIQLLLKEYQVQQARTLGMTNDSSIDQDDYLRQLIVGWAYVYGLTNTLFNFARREHTSINDDAFSITSGLSAAGILVTEQYDEEMGLYLRTFQRRA